MSNFDGKAIYNPKGKAGEYSEWASNFYTGCSNDCEYCYCKKGFMGRLWSTTPQLKKCFKDEVNALDVFVAEMGKNLAELREHGLFFTFTSDPMLPETRRLTWAAVIQAVVAGVPVQILTKRADFLHDEYLALDQLQPEAISKIAFGFTMTGCNDREPNASTNEERMEAMEYLHGCGFKTFASIEPIIDLGHSLACVLTTLGICDLYKIGLLSGKTDYDIDTFNRFVQVVTDAARDTGAKVYWKESVRALSGISGLDSDVAVNKGYNIFKG